MGHFILRNNEPLDARERTGIRCAHMSSEPVSVYVRARGFIILMFGVAVATAFSLTPTSASAASVNVITKPVIPQAGVCVQPVASAFKAYVYEGNVHSFDIEISDPTYVAVAGSIGEQGIPFIQMNRRITSTGALRIHADVSSTPANQLIYVTLLSAKQGGPICVTQIAIHTDIAQQVLETIAYSGGSTAGSYTAPKKVSSAAYTADTSNKEKGGEGADVGAASATASAISAIKDTVKQNACGAKSGTSRLWFIFLVLYVLALGAIALSRPPATHPYPVAWLISAILIPLFLLLAFWYVLSVCGVSKWVPILALIVGLAGIAIALRGSEKDTGLAFLAEKDAPEKTPVMPIPGQSQLPIEVNGGAEKTVIIMPPAAPKDTDMKTLGAVAATKEEGGEKGKTEPPKSA